jgi:hypothetical protein
MLSPVTYVTPYGSVVNRVDVVYYESTKWDKIVSVHLSLGSCLPPVKNAVADKVKRFGSNVQIHTFVCVNFHTHVCLCVWMWIFGPSDGGQSYRVYRKGWRQRRWPHNRTSQEQDAPLILTTLETPWKTDFKEKHVSLLFGFRFWSSVYQANGGSHTSWNLEFHIFFNLFPSLSFSTSVAPSAGRMALKKSLSGLASVWHRRVSAMHLFLHPQ